MKKLARHAKKSKGKSNSTKDAVEAAADDGGEIGDASEVAKPPLKRVRAKSASSTPARAPKPIKKAPASKASKKKNSGKDTDKAEGDDSPAHEGHDDDDAGPATFARRYRPTRPFYQQKWLALRDSYATYIRPFVKNHSKLEDPVGF